MEQQMKELREEKKFKSLYEPLPPHYKGEKVQKVAQAILVELLEQNKAREEAGLKPLKVKTRECLRCRSWMESIGKHLCRDCTGFARQVGLAEEMLRGGS